MEIKIRSAGSSDAEAVHRLTLQLGYEPSLESVRESLEELGENHVVLVAEHDGHVMAWIEVMVSHFVTSSDAMICGLVVDEGCRGQKIGERLCLAAEAWAMGRGMNSIRVRSRQTRERAHKFYRMLGYEVYKAQFVFRKEL